MKRFLFLCWLASCLLMTTVCHAQPIRRWDFDRSGDLEQWSGPANVRAKNAAGNLWLTQMEPATNDLWGRDLASSPSGLQISAAEVTQVRLRVLNLSSLTDFYLRWNTVEDGWGIEMPKSGFWANFMAPPPHARRCTLRADLKDWQEITCYIDLRWTGTINQIALGNARKAPLRGDLWIDWIEIGKGPPEPIRIRPDVASNDVVPHITVPGLSQQGFHEAFKVLDRRLIMDVPMFGLTYPFMSAGEHYHEGGWWLLDTSVAVTGAKWANQKFADDVLRAFAECQATNPDGHLDMGGFFATGGQPESGTQIPKYFEVAYDIARRTADDELREHIYGSMRQFLDWWLSPVKRDARTGLVTGYGEETFQEYLQANDVVGHGKHLTPQTVAPVDLNVLIAVAAAQIADLATAVGRPQEAEHYQKLFAELSRAINQYLWDDQKGAYYNYNVREGKRHPTLNVATFDPLRLGIAPLARRDRLLKRLLDPKEFNWGKRPLTSWPMNQHGFVMEGGDEDVKAQFGGIWMFRNMMVVDALEDSARPDLAAELNWSTVQIFHSNYREFAHASTGAGHGAVDYALTASQHIGAIVEHLFGIDFDRIKKRIQITPHIPKALYGKKLALENLRLPTAADARLSVFINQSSARAAKISVSIDGPLPEGSLEIALPGGTERLTVPVQREISVKFP